MESTLEIIEFVIGMLGLFSLYAYFTNENKLGIVELLLRVVFFNVCTIFSL